MERSEERDLAEQIATDDRVMEMFSIVAHELATPLTLVQGYAFLLDDVIGAQPESEAVAATRQTLGELTRSIEIMRLMLDRLRDGWGADEGLRLQREPADLALVVREAVTDLGAMLLTDHPLEVDAPSSLAIDIDVPRIRQVLFNLLTNAKKYSAAGAPIIVALTGDDDEVRIDVRNHGYGIATDDLEHIFDRFARVDDTAGQGLGIGLWLSRTIARAHGGDLRAIHEESEGSRFVLTLPR